MSAFCSKYPKCGCKGIGTKCYDDFNITVTAGENLPQETKDALTELTKLAVEKTFIKIARKNIWDMLEKLQKGECMKADVMEAVDAYSVEENRNHLRQLLIEEKATTAMFQKEIDGLRQQPVKECWVRITEEEWFSMGVVERYWLSSALDESTDKRYWLKKVSLPIAPKECCVWVKESEKEPPHNVNLFMKAHYGKNVIMGIGIYRDQQAPYWQSGIALYGNSKLPTINPNPDYIEWLQQLQAVVIQPKEIEEYFKHKKHEDDMGWTGEYHLSAKDILDFLIDKGLL
jgi:hypothetical protein